jgi:hypothetical protein
MNTSPHPSLAVALLALIGRTISAVTFVESYVHIELQGSRMSVLAKMHLVRDDQSVASDAADFSNALLACVGAQVLGVREKGDQLIVWLSPDKTLEINLADSSVEPEAFIYQDGTGRVWVA